MHFGHVESTWPPETHNHYSTTCSIRPWRPLEWTFNNQGWKVADEYDSHCIYANGLAFNLVCSPYYKKLVKEVNEAPNG